MTTPTLAQLQQMKRDLNRTKQAYDEAPPLEDATFWMEYEVARNLLNRALNELAEAEDIIDA